MRNGCLSRCARGLHVASRLLLKPGGRDKAGQMADRRTEMKTIDAAVGVVDGRTRSGGEGLTELEKWGTLAAQLPQRTASPIQQRTYTPTANIQYD